MQRKSCNKLRQQPKIITNLFERSWSRINAYCKVVHNWSTQGAAPKTTEIEYAIRNQELVCRRSVERRRRWMLISTNKEHTDQTEIPLKIDRRGSVLGFWSRDFGGQNEKSARYSSNDSSSSDIAFLCSILDTNSSCTVRKREKAIKNYHLNGCDGCITATFTIS